MKIYTKTGDQGMTGLYGGQRVPKSAPRIIAYGEIDELNSVIGLTCSETPHDPIRKALSTIQSDLFVVGAQLASPKTDSKVEVLTAAHVDALERQIDVMSENLTPIKNFILPGGGRTAALLHLARAVCRRAERSTFGLATIPTEKVDRWILIYLNRLSDYLFTLARLANQLEKIEEVVWKGRK
ncbi:MAG: cob(I)yrinic acid a,c-diamide adenosyltransferase [Deltaproteobacteria bacterium]|nr:cob(I)yrinic acid a,c-diamide adenosyltransferase [Deltaproteobacteria bacterium]